MTYVPFCNYIIGGRLTGGGGGGVLILHVDFKKA